MTRAVLPCAAVFSSAWIRLGVSCWVLEKATVLYRLAAAQRKPADDITQLATLYEVWAGVQIRALGAAH